MKKFLIYYLFSFALLSAFIFYSGCSEVDTDISTAPEVSGFHGAGWTSPGSGNFHGDVISSSNWNMDGCKGCHGTDYKGGASGLSCFKCHTGGPEGCNVCHGNPQHPYPPESLNGNTLNTQQGVGAHVRHLTSDSLMRRGAQVECTECHREITSFSDTNHIKPDNMNLAEIVFGPLAKKSSGGGINPNPVWDKNAQKCSNVYCHGYFRNGNLTNAPVFTNPQTGSKCGSCHGDPVSGNPRPGGTHPVFDNCYICHGVTIDSAKNFVNISRHINGTIDFNR